MTEPTFTTGHAPIIDALPAAGALPDAREEVLALLATQVRLNADGALLFTEADGTPALDPADGYKDFTAETFVAHIQRTRPHIFVAGSKRNVNATKPPASVSSKVNFSELMIRARQGDKDARRQLDEVTR